MNTIIYVSPHFGNFGAERSMIAIANHIKENDIKAMVIIPCEGEICDLLKQKKIEYRILPFRMWINIAKGTRRVTGKIKALINEYLARKLAKDLIKNGERVVLIHSNSINTDFGIRLAKQLKVKHIQHIREFGKNDFNMCFDIGEDKALNYIDKGSDKIVCISEGVKNYYNNSFAQEKLVRIYNGVSIGRVGGKQSSADSIFRIVIVGRYSKEKGQIEAVKAVAELVKLGYKNIVLDLYGQGQGEDEIREEINSNNVAPYVHICGYKNDNNLSMYDVALMCSKSEAFGRVTIEYMLNGLPVIGANIGGTIEIIEDGVSGLLYTSGDIFDLAKKIKYYIDNPKEREKAGSAALNRAVDSFSEESYLKNIMQLYQEVEGGKIENV